MKKILVSLPAFSLLIAITFSPPHQDGHKNITNEELPPLGATTTCTN